MNTKLKNHLSMLSTYNMSCTNCSKTTNMWVHSSKRIKSALLAYADIPMSKESPHWNQSVATWRNSSPRYTFSRSSRFKDQKAAHTDILKPNISIPLSKKACTMGKGRRKPISQIVLRNAKQTPSPNSYCTQTYDNEPRKKGRTFSLGRNAYEKLYIDHRKDVYAQFQTKQNPLIKYEISEKIGETKPRYSFGKRLKMYTKLMSDSRKWVPGPYYVGLKRRNRRNGSYQDGKGGTFTGGNRIDLAAPANNNPAGKYIIQGFCDKFKILSQRLQ